jgi:hypothetical protein
MVSFLSVGDRRAVLGEGSIVNPYVILEALLQISTFPDEAALTRQTPESRKLLAG